MTKQITTTLSFSQFQLITEALTTEVNKLTDLLNEGLAEPNKSYVLAKVARLDELGELLYESYLEAEEAN